MDDHIGFSEEYEVIKGNDGVTVIQVRGEDGKGNGSMTVYEIMPGIALAYNDFHMEKIKSDFTPQGEMFCVDHCREGRIEQEVSPGVFRYVGVGDLRLDNRQNHATNFYFPLSHYHGITIQFEMDQAEESIRRIMPDFPMTVGEIRSRFCKEENCSYLRSEAYAEHIFAELYHVPGKIRKHFMILKVLELLLDLWSLDNPQITESAVYYAKSQTDKVKAIKQLISEDLQKHYTMEELAERFDISATGMKSVFKAIYGKPIYAYLQELRMQRASALLLEGNRSITEIAGEVGYESPGKFSGAFKKAMNLSPLEFRNGKDGLK